MGRITSRVPVVRIVVGGDESRRLDTVVVEEPLEMRVGGHPLAVTMRTPGHDVELATGFLVSEGIIVRGEQFLSAIHCAGPGDAENTYNVLDIALAEGVVVPEPNRNFTITSSCGVCGKASIDAVETVSRYDLSTDAVTVSATALAGFPAALREAQAVFEKTGGLHAAGVFDAETGRMLVVREDVGRHNAVDKVVGWAAQQDLLPLTGTVLQVSGRVSFELVQKAVMAGIPILAAVSAPSSLAIEFAQRAGMTLVGFSRGETLNVYAHPERILR